MLKITTQNAKILLPGDIGKKTEADLVQSLKSKLKADILIVPHHGSKHSSSLEFVSAVAPKYAIVSAGHLNKFGHPNESTLAIYTNLGIKTMETSKCGAISFKLENKGNNISSLKPSCYRISVQKFWNTDTLCQLDFVQ